MADSEIEDILKELLARQDLSADTREDFEEFQSAARAGKLEPADRRYVVAFAKRVDAKSAAGVTVETPAEADFGGYDEEQSWRERAHEAEARAEAAEAKLQAVKDAVERTVGGAASLDEGPEAQARRELYEALRQEIERIETGEG